MEKYFWRKCKTVINLIILEIFQKMYTMHVKIALEQPFPTHFTNKLCVRITDSNGRLCFSPGYI